MKELKCFRKQVAESSVKAISLMLSLCYNSNIIILTPVKSSTNPLQFSVSVQGPESCHSSFISKKTAGRLQPKCRFITLKL